MKFNGFSFRTEDGTELFLQLQEIETPGNQLNVKRILFVNGIQTSDAIDVSVTAVEYRSVLGAKHNVFEMVPFDDRVNMFVKPIIHQGKSERLPGEEIVKRVMEHLNANWPAKDIERVQKQLSELVNNS